MTEQTPTQELAALAEIADIFTQQMGYLDKFRRLLEVFGRVGEMESVTLRKPDREEHYLELVTSWGRQLIEDVVDLSEPSPALVAVEAYRRSAGFVVNSASNSGDAPMARMPTGLGSAFALPIKAEGTILGVLSFSSSRPGHFTESRVRLLTTVGNSIGVLFQNAQLQEERAVEDNIASIVGSRLDMDDVYERFVLEVRKILDFDRIGVYTLDRNEATVDVQFLRGLEVAGFSPGPGWSIEGSVIGKAIETREPVLLHHDDQDVLDGKYEAMAVLFDAGYQSMVAVPLKSANQFVGAFGLSIKSRKYTTSDLARVARIGNLLGGAVEGFRLRTVQSQIQSELAETQDRLRQIAENISGIFWLVQIEPTKLIYVSPGYERLWGRPPDDVSEDWRAWYKHAIPEDQETYKKELDENFLTGQFNAQFRVARPDGSIRWLSVRGFPIRDLSGKLYRMGGITEDITEQKENAARLAETERLATIGELSAGMAHEINNPLASVVLYSGTLLEGELPEDVRKDLQIVQSSAKRAAKIVRNLLLFSRRSVLEKQPQQLDRLVHRSIAIMAEEYPLDEIEIINEIPGDLPSVLVDDVQIVEVLLNILNNARQACLSADGRGRITLGTQVTDDVLSISVNDNGPGIPQDIQRRIFEPFFTTKEVGSGTGLGLSLSIGVMARHDGDIRVESEEGKGATFVLEFPVSHAEHDVESRPAGAGLPGTSPSTRRVLVVDDEPDLRNIIVRHLAAQNFIVDEAADGLEGLEKLRAKGYDCIFLDLKMSGMGGKEMYQNLLDHHPKMATRVIFMSGDTINPETQAFLERSSNPVLEKPFDSGDLLGHLARMVDLPVQ